LHVLLCLRQSHRHGQRLRAQTVLLLLLMLLLLMLLLLRML